MEQAILITVALCTHNHADRLRRTLNDFKALRSPTHSWELLVVDNSSTDDTPKLLADAAWHPPGVEVRIVQETKLGLSNARNRAIEEARGKYLLFVDDDETPDPAWLVAYEDAMLHFEPDALGGRIEVLFEQGARPPWLQDELLGFLGQLNHGEEGWLTDSTTPFYGGNFAVRKAIFTQVGLFDADLGRKGRVNTGGEDTEFYRRLVAQGYRVRWVPDAIINHRIIVDKLRRSYFLELHYRQGLAEGSRKRGSKKRLPPFYLFGQLVRSINSALQKRWSQGKDFSLRLEMNAIYFFGYIHGWITK
ncbi:MAG: glycosyltransferase [Chromatiaceae bacterium]|nr:glycosyltransferase [Chromatiaceae bacterium]